MSKIRPEKVETVDEVKARVETTSTAVVTEYRGLTVTEIQQLRKQLRGLGADYKVFKNSLVRRAITGTSVEPMTEFLVGPTAIAFVDGDVSAVAKALKDFAKESPKLIIKGGVLDGKALSLSDLVALADLPSRDVLLAQLAGLIASPLRTMAGLIKAVPQNFAYGLSALIDSKGGAAAPAAVVEEVVEAAETPAGVEEAAPAASDDAAAEVAEVAVEETALEVVAEAETTEAPSEEVASEPAE
ncbi:MAG: 50S ribosomal protein L10 [Acidimicrobiaceae bacterium]|jgi:large subunit ribosomal protein L10